MRPQFLSHEEKILQNSFCVCVAVYEILTASQLALPVEEIQKYILYFPGYKSIREISRPKFLGLKTRLSSYTCCISRPTFLDDWLWKDMDAEDDTADAEEEWDPYDVLTGLTDAETL